MKKVISILFVLAFCSFKTQTEKTFTFKFSEASLNYHWGNLGGIKKIIGESNLPHQQVVFIVNSIDSLQIAIANQVKGQIEPVKPK